jgi:hypothetical protein
MTHPGEDQLFWFRRPGRIIDYRTSCRGINGILLFLRRIPVAAKEQAGEQKREDTGKCYCPPGD